ncbi:MAG TPA: FmdB family zinc ribbon protein [Ktedonobacteraceae bacterium]|nr:FmdB family zinc ribbon protein [Ktedonobacteraceae bacterium]
MPTYEYLCHACSHRFETWQKMTDEPLTVCPECGGHIRRVLYPAGIVFKGSGFYKTDYGNGSVAGSNGHNEHNEHNGSNGDKKAEGSADKASESKSSESKAGENGPSSTTASESKAAANSGTK